MKSNYKQHEVTSNTFLQKEAQDQTKNDMKKKEIKCPPTSPFVEVIRKRLFLSQ